MAERNSWTGSAAELWRASAHRSSHDLLSSLAACVARKTFLRALGIDIAFSREGRAGSRIIRIRATQENIVSTVSSVCDQPAPRPAGDVCDDDSRSDLVGRYPMGQASVTAADDAEGVLTQTPPFVSGSHRRLDHHMLERFPAELNRGSLRFPILPTFPHFVFGLALLAGAPLDRGRNHDPRRTALALAPSASSAAGPDRTLADQIGAMTKAQKRRSVTARLPI